MKIFLGGTCNNSNWRDRLITHLKIDYFNPVVDDWNIECQKEEIRQRKECDLVLYTITPKMTGVYSIAEVVDDSNKRPDRTILAIMKEDGDYMFTDSQWKSLLSVIRMVDSNGAKTRVNPTIIELADFINKIKI